MPLVVAIAISVGMILAYQNARHDAEVRARRTVCQAMSDC